MFWFPWEALVKCQKIYISQRHLERKILENKYFFLVTYIFVYSKVGIKDIRIKMECPSSIMPEKMS